MLFAKSSTIQDKMSTRNAYSKNNYDFDRKYYFEFDKTK